MASSPDLSEAKPRVDFADFAIATVSALALALTVLFLCVVPFSGTIAGGRDFVVYWSTGQQLIHHANPYDPAAMMRIEHAAGLNSEYKILYMRNPPWVLPFVLPLGLIGPRFAALIWSLGIVGCVLVSVHLLRKMHGSPQNQLHWLGLSFGPAMICAIMGQTSVFALLGYVLFLYLHRSRPFLAGASLWLCALKPHLFLPFGLVLLVWIVLSRSYRILAGALVAIAASCALAWLIYPSAWSDYAKMMHAANLGSEYIPCLIVVLRLHFSPQSIWLQYLVPALGSVWALAWFWPRRQGWDWRTRGHLLVLVSLLAAPYSWVYDGVLAIPALLQGAYATRSRFLLVLLAIASLTIEIELVLGIKVASAAYLWTTPAWFAWYLLARASAVHPMGKPVVAELQSQVNG
ncbi:MAG TPA: glycosyltransferase family 87 protein [Terracidiphilus sp.]|nr:glycosyltransferase family 87 protein [Terracidiphilus sp.]